MKAFLVLLAIFAIANAANVGIAHIKGTSLDAGITGTAYFVQLNETYHWVWVSVSGITVNPELQHGVHVHTWGDVTDQAAAASAGGHYIGGGSLTHQCEDNDTRHQGDMGNWQATGGNITFSKTLNLLASTGGNSIIGRSIVIHQLADNCTAQPLGAAGTRLAFGVIGISNPMLWPQAVLTALGLTNYTANGAVSGATDVTRAVAVLRATAVNPAFASLVGNVTFEQDATSGDVTVTGIFSGLTAGQGFGLHIHLYGDYSVNATAVSDHFGAGIVAHGGPNNDTRHYGDLGNICSFDSTGIAYYRWVMTDDKFTLSGANSILGRSVVVHAVYDTMRPSSAFGARIAQGVIGAANATNAPIITIPTGFNVSDPICASVAPTPSPATTTTAAATTNAATTNAATTRPATSTTGASSSASFVAVCFTAVIALFAVVLF